MTEEDFEQLVVRTGSQGAALAQARLEALLMTLGIDHNSDADQYPTAAESAGPTVASRVIVSDGDASSSDRDWVTKVDARAAVDPTPSDQVEAAPLTLLSQSPF